MDTPLRKARKARKLTLEDLAGKLGVTVGQMSRIERFGTNHLAHALKLAEIVELPVEAFAPSAEAA